MQNLAERSLKPTGRSTVSLLSTGKVVRDVLIGLGPSALFDKIYRNMLMRFFGPSFFNRPITNCIERVARMSPDSTFIDIGANHGVIAFRVRHAFPACVLIEPVPEFCEELSSRIAKEHANNCIIVPVAAGDSVGTKRLYVSRTSDGDVSFNQDTRRLLGPVVPIERLDTIVRNLSASPPFVLKLDVQGYEVKVLRGATNVLEQSIAIVTEVWPWGLERSGNGLSEMVGILHSKGFVARTLGGGEVSASRLQMIDTVGRQNENLQTDLLFDRIAR